MPDPHFFDYQLDPMVAVANKLVQLREDGPAIVLHGGTIVDGLGRKLDGTLVIRGDRIVDILAPGVRPTVDEHARWIDCTGQTILPGMFDLHVHMMGTSEHNRFLSHLIPQAGVRALRVAFEAYQLLAHGFTTVLSLGHGDSDHTFGLREAIAEGVINGPRTYHVGWYLAPSHLSETWLPRELVDELRVTMHVPVDGEAEIRSVIRGNAAEGAGRRLHRAWAG